LDTAIHAAHEKTAHGSAPDERVLTNAHEILHDEALELVLTDGQSTTSALLSWGLKYLIGHPDVQAKLRAELESVFDDGDTGVQPPVNTIVSRSIPYLTVIAETLHLVSDRSCLLPPSGCVLYHSGPPVTRKNTADSCDRGCVA
jgi:cytochrome P450